MKIRRNISHSGKHEMIPNNSLRVLGVVGGAAAQCSRKIQKLTEKEIHKRPTNCELVSLSSNAFMTKNLSIFIVAFGFIFVARFEEIFTNCDPFCVLSVDFVLILWHLPERHQIHCIKFIIIFMTNNEVRSTPFFAEN